MNNKVNLYNKIQPENIDQMDKMESNKQQFIQQEDELQKKPRSKMNIENNSINQENENNEIVENNNSSLESNEDKNKKKPLTWKTVLPRAIIIAIIITLIVLVIVYRSYVNEQYTIFIKWLTEHKLAGFFSLIGIYIIATVAFFPGLILTLGAGFCFNEAFGNQLVAILVGGLAVFIGAMIGSTLALIISRYLLRDLFDAMASKWKYFKAIDQVIGIEGFQIVLLLRLAPVAPFNLLNYFFGITTVKITQYILGGLGMIPGIFVYVYFGTSLQKISDVISGNYDGGATYIIFMIVGATVSFVGLVYIGVIARKKINKIVEKEKEKEQKKKNSRENSAQNISGQHDNDNEKDAVELKTP